MNHLKISIAKSALRIAGSIATIVLACINIPAALLSLGITFGVAEVLGILEEVFDKRKEQ